MIGIDVGGTFIKGGLIDRTGRIFASGEIPTEPRSGAEHILSNIASLIARMSASAGVRREEIAAIGMGIPGLIDSHVGTVAFSSNISWDKAPICRILEQKTGLPVKITNDANAAALGEAHFGAGKRYADSIFITLGTGIGGGIIVNKKLLEGNRAAGAEIGHMIIVKDGAPCSCGMRGCFEAYASTKALIRDTKRAMEAHPESAMWEIGGTDAVDGKTPFAYSDRDETARAVLERYSSYLSTGLVNLANIFRPEAIIIGGGVSAQGDKLLVPLQERLDRDIFGKEHGPKVPLFISELGNSAGFLGAAALNIEPISTCKGE